MAKFCPECGKPTVKKMVDNILRNACGDGHFIQFAKTKVGVGALIIHDGKVLLVERGIRSVGIWTLVSGHLEQDETIDEAIKREVYEEVRLAIEPQGLIYVRNQQERGANDLYLVFLCHVTGDATPKPDGVETADARFLSPDKLTVVNVSPYTQWFVQNYFERSIQPWRWQSTGFDTPKTRIYTQAGS